MDNSEICTMRFLCFFPCLVVLFFGVGCDSMTGDLEVSAANTVLRKDAGPDAIALRRLYRGDQLHAAGRVSPFFSPLQFGDTLLEAPWVRVRTSDNMTGWVFALDLIPQSGDAGIWLLEQNLQALLTPEIAGEYRAWRAMADSAFHSPENTAAWYMETARIRDRINGRMQHRPERNAADYQPNLLWLAPALPKMQLRWLQPEELPTACLDFAAMNRSALGTPAPQDDAFFNFCIRLFPSDSLESPFLPWRMPVSTHEQYSRLGSGQHRGLLQAIDSTLEIAPAFREPLLVWKEAILNDILDHQTAYWQAAEPIRKELDQLLLQPPACLSTRDRLALEERRRMFDDPAANNIRVDVRSGK